MTEPRDPPQTPEEIDDALLRIAGILSSGVATEIARPLRQLRETLAGLVDTLDNFVASAKGPVAMPFNKVGDLRDVIAEAYLVSRNVARLSRDLSGAVAPQSSMAAVVDLNRSVDAALNLARHRIASDTEVYVDYGTIPQVRVVPARLVMSIAQVILTCADATHDLADRAIWLRTRRVGDRAIIRIDENGRCSDDAVHQCLRLVERLLRPTGTTIDTVSDDESDRSFELSVPLGNP